MRVEPWAQLLFYLFNVCTVTEPRAVYSGKPVCDLGASNFLVLSALNNTIIPSSNHENIFSLVLKHTIKIGGKGMM